MGYVHLACWVLVAGVLLVSAASKLRSRRAFAQFEDSLRRMRVVPEPLVRPVAAAAVLAESLTVVLLAVPALARAGQVLAAGLVVALTAALALSLRRGAHAPCRCFGGSTQPIGTPHLVRNGLLLAAVAVALGTGPPPAYEAAAVVVSAFAGAAGTLLVVFFVDFVSLFRLPAAAGSPAAPPSAPPKEGTSR